jgi:hypothetical protein
MTILERFVAVEDVEFVDPQTERVHRVSAGRGGMFNPVAVHALVRQGKMRAVPEVSWSAPTEPYWGRREFVPPLKGNLR